MHFTQGRTDITPAEANYNETRLAVLNNHFQAVIDAKEIQCATYCVSRGGKVFAHGAVGKKTFHKDDDTPALPTSVRYIASITKTFTAVAIMKLVEDGITRLDVTVGSILPQFNTAPYNQINLFHLLTHTSGLHADSHCYENKYQTNYWEMIEKAYKLRDGDKKDFDWIAAALSTIGCGMQSKPGAEWAYCSFGFIILGAVIEKLAGMSAHKYIEDNIAKPLKMTDTAFDLTPDLAKRSIYTDAGHEKSLNKIIKGTYKPEWIGEKLNIPNTGGGLNSTAYDLVRFGNMMLFGGTFDGARVIGRKAAEKMSALAIHNVRDDCWNANNPDRRYSIGFDMRRDTGFTFSDSTYMHEGAGACALYVDPKEELVAVWIVPYVKDGWFPRAVWSTQNVIWSGLM